jgi:hypothetical protein
MAQRWIHFDANSLLKLLTHYTMDHDDQIPLDAELRSAGVSTVMGRYIVLEVESKEWNGMEPETTGLLPLLHVRFEGDKVLSWTQSPNNPVHTKDSWKDQVGSPR